ncbi:uncharacterized protein LOC135835692 [Planococcus citri]|uniref:uncharacterized protein LOC135835692 n=1 Tax=Planococcus citri TaxID=170843 RepID=UPI0031F7C304
MFLKNFSYLTFLCSFFTASVKADFQLPSYLKQCSKKSPDFHRCMLDNEEALLPHIIDGNETLNIPNLNPMFVPKIVVKQGNKQIGLSMEVTDVKIYGMGGLKINQLDLNMDKKHLKTRIVIPRLEIIGNHKTTGNIMVVKVYGQGKFNITAVGVDLEYENDFDYETKEDGHVYTMLKSQKIKMLNFKRVHYNLENMLGDDKLDTAVNELLNQYWRELSFDLFGEMQEDLLDIMRTVVNVILGVYPVDVIITDYNS